jgi:epoxide hydrolase
MPAEVTPLRIEIPQADVADLAQRLRRTRWPEPETVGDWSQGVPLAYLRDLCRYWADGYDWRATEARLNGLPQFHVAIDNVAVHFIHVRSARPGAMPLIITHGRPGSVIEYLKVIAPLTDPAGHGRDPADAFDVVLPSLPGYGFSGKPDRPGWGAGHIAGIHLVPPLAGPDPAAPGDLTDAERETLTSLERTAEGDSGYSRQHATRPQTIGYALTDSPAALCAWIIEKFWAWTDHGGHLEDVLTRDELLDNLMLYWLPRSGASAARLYWESIRQVNEWISGAAADPVTVPVGCSIFPGELQRRSRRWAQRRFPDIRYWGEPARGGHFAAFEQPDLFVNEISSFFRLIR